MDISNYLNNDLLERYALDELNEQQTKEINDILAVSLELGEALEQVYTKLEEKEAK